LTNRSEHSKNIVVLGGGESGTGAALLAKARKHHVFLSDGGRIAPGYRVVLEQAGIEFEEGGHSLDHILAANEIVKSPGIPWTVPAVAQALEKGIPVIDELELAYRYTQARIIAVTGTNGKTTTTLLIHHLLKEAGYNVGLAGNVGHSMARQVVEDPYDWYVVEVSSFQLEGCKQFRPEIALLLNITPDHLDRYGYNFDKYVEAKFRIARRQTLEDEFIYFADNEPVVEGLKKFAVKAHLRPVSLSTQQTEGAYRQGEQLVLDAARQPLHIAVENLSLKGRHNIINSMSAALAAKLAGVPGPAIVNGLESFKNAEHRMEPVATVQGVQFVNDSKGTNVDSVYYALDAYQKPIVWVAGGIDKGNDYDFIRGLVQQKVRALVCLGTDNSKLKAYFTGVVPHIEEAASATEAVRKAFALAQEGDVVLLSPACSSFDLFKNYMDRGTQFKQAVMALKTETPTQTPRP